jgi:hypothetical protein
MIQGSSTPLAEKGVEGVANAVTQGKGTSLRELLDQLARHPQPVHLWNLRGALLACTTEHPDTRLLDEITKEFFIYLNELHSKLTARQYNELASRLDIGSVGMLALQDILVEHTDLWKNLALGAVGEGMMVLASRQYVKAWEQELGSVQRHAGWVLYGVLWELSQQNQPGLGVAERQALIEGILQPIWDEETPLEGQILLLMRLFQILLLLLAAPLCEEQQRLPEG